MTRHLIITYFYAPLNSPRAFRWSGIAEAWAQQGDDVTIITALRPGLAPEETINGVKIYRTGSTQIDQLRSQLGKNNPHLKNADENITPQKPDRIKQIIKKTIARIASFVHHGVWKNIYWPDVTCLWYFSAIKQVKTLMRSNTYDTIITVSPTFTAHVIGRQSKKLYPQLHWLVDIGDPFCFTHADVPNNRHLYNRWNYHYERQVFKEAECITVTTQPTQDEYSKLFPESAHKITVIPPLISLPKTPITSKQERIFPDDGTIRITFTGTLYKTIRRPDFLLALFKEVSSQLEGTASLELHFFGNTQNAADAFLPYEQMINKQICLHGLVERNLAIQAMQESDILVNIGNDTHYQLPSKVVEYAALARPIINIAKIANDSSSLFFSDYPYALCLVDENKTLDEKLIRQVQDFIINRPATILLPSGWIERFTVESIAQTYNQAIQAGSS